jgi:Protein of unknown function (DUF3396)
MSAHYPRIRIHAKNGYLLVREGLNLTFYIRRCHRDISREVTRSVEACLRAVGPNALGLYADEEGNWQLLDEAGWAVIHQELNDPQAAYVSLADASNTEQRYRFFYQGRDLDSPFLKRHPGAVSAVSFWLPTEYLEEHGPGRVRELAMELALPLPFCTGNTGRKRSPPRSVRAVVASQEPGRREGAGCPCRCARMASVRKSSTLRCCCLSVVTAVSMRSM